MPHDRPGASGVERLYGIHSVREALRARRRRLHHLWLRRGELSPALREVLEAAEAAGVGWSQVGPDALRERAGCQDNPQGVVLEAGPLPEAALPALLEGAGDAACLVALDGVEDPRNVGAVVRAAETAGARGLILGRRRAPPLGPALAHASAGAAEWLPIARVTNLVRALRQLREAGWWTLGGDPHARESIFDVPDRIWRGRLVVVLGAEGRGIRPGVREQVDHPLRIPMAGRVASLNVAAAGAVLLFERLRRTRDTAVSSPRGRSATSR